MSRRSVAGFTVGEYYQDLWIKGKRVAKGPRECEERYERVAEFCRQYKRPFTVLDWGAQMGYFSLRLAEDFDCTVVAVERDPNLFAILQANDNPKVLYINRRMTPQDFVLLGKVEHFDLVLALSVVHHNSAASFTDWLKILGGLGDHLIMELALEPTATGQAMVRQSKVPDGAEILGETNAHFGTCAPRPMFAMHHQKTRIDWPFMGCSAHTDGVVCDGFDVTSDFDKKVNHKGQDWIRGINLATFLYLHGRWPTGDRIADMLEEGGLPEDGHLDIGEHNVILSGDRATLIDGYDQHQQPGTDKEHWNKMIGRLRA